jgi:hypothetical protein
VGGKVLGKKNGVKASFLPDVLFVAEAHVAKVAIPFLTHDSDAVTRRDRRESLLGREPAGCAAG